MLTLSFISCDKQEEAGPDASIQNSVYKDVELLKSDARFTGLIQKNINIAVNLEGLDENSHLTNGCPESNPNFEELSLALGFETITEFEDFSEGQYTALRALSLEFDLASIEENEMIDLMMGVLPTLDIKSSSKNDEAPAEVSQFSIAESGTAAVFIQLGCSTSDFSSNVGGLLCQTNAILRQAEAF
jgi:hypothetical protein